MLVERLTKREANVNPKRTLPTSPIKTLAFGILKGRKPKQLADNAVLIKAISSLSTMKEEKTAMNPKPTNPVKPAIPSIPSIKL